MPIEHVRRVRVDGQLTHERDQLTRVAGLRPSLTRHAVVALVGGLRPGGDRVPNDGLWAALRDGGWLREPPA